MAGSRAIGVVLRPVEVGPRNCEAAPAPGPELRLAASREKPGISII